MRLGASLRGSGRVMLRNGSVLTLVRISVTAAFTWQVVHAPHKPQQRTLSLAE